MKRFAVLGAGMFLLGGCALPVPIQVASWALDGISYMMTEKSVTDHGISVLTQKDCAVLRGLLDPGEFCRDFDDSATALAEGMSYDNLFDNSETIGAEVDAIADFETAGGGDVSTPVAAYEETDPGSELNELTGRPLAFDDGVEVVAVFDFDGITFPNVLAQQTIAKAKTDAAPKEVEKKTKSVVSKEWAARTTRNLKTGLEPASGYYFVIGSFRDHANARNLRNQFRIL
ncbi:MAG: hypothetical protein HN719_06570, partial [Alphaproteobacteria bacterium]|nr:hypothetical protein [Alphaproteobacteria bacterium]